MFELENKLITWL